MDDLNARLRQLPAVHVLLNSPEGQALAAKYGHNLVAEAAGSILEKWRKRLTELTPEGRSLVATPELLGLSREIENYLEKLWAPHYQRVVNATGIILHTNLGRSLICQQAADAVEQAATAYTNLEYDLEHGSRGERYAHVEGLLQKLTGAESAMVVNNNAAAILLVLHTLAPGKEVLISRGQLVEIGGSFRVPEVLKLGGVKLVEVGTTNRTRLQDYREAINENTGLILKVHTSNYRVVGFTSTVSREELAGLAHERGIPYVEDLGSGALLDLSVYGLTGEPTIGEALKAGADVVTFSGDKLLGGPQAGMIVGKTAYLDKMKQNQLTRALRIDKLTVAALEATLREYLHPETVMQNLPIYAMLTASTAELKAKGEKIRSAMENSSDRVEITLENTVAQMGGGSLPGQEIPSVGLALVFQGYSATEVEVFFRTRLAVPVLGYIAKDRYILDLRTLLPGDEEIIITGIRTFLQENPNR